MLSLTWALIWRTLVWMVPVGLLGAWLPLQLAPELAIHVDYITWKPSFIYGAFAILVLLSDAVVKANPLQLLFGWRLQLSQQEWRRISFALCGLMALLAVLNVVVASTGNIDLWVNYKLFGAVPILLIGLALIARNIASVRAVARA